MFRTIDIEEVEKDEKRTIAKVVVIGMLWAAFKFCVAGIVLIAACKYIGLC